MKRQTMVIIGVAAICVAGAILLVTNTGQPSKPKVTASEKAQQRATAAELAKKKKIQRQSGGAGTAAGPGSASTGAPGIIGINTSTDTTTAEGVTIRPFADNSPWNTRIDTQSIDPHSARYMRLANTRVGIVENGNAPPKPTTVVNKEGIFINTKRWTAPIYSTKGGIATKLLCRQLPPYCGDGADTPSLPIPATASPEPQYDGYFVLEDPVKKKAYTMWRSRRGSNTLFSYQFMRNWDLNGPGYQVPNSVSTLGSGLPSFAGYIHPEEIKAGRIDHALAIALPGPARNKYVQPASATDGVGSSLSIPEGARIRLKANYRPKRLFPRTNRVAQMAIIKALKRYGAIVVERAKVPTLYAKRNYNWSQSWKDAQGRLLGPDGRLLSANARKQKSPGTPLLRGNEVQGIHLRDFEVIKITGKVYRFPSPDTAVPEVNGGATSQ